METVRLYTALGGFVAEAVVPVFQPRAEVLIWGERFFACVNGSDRYVEVLAWPIRAVSQPTPEAAPQ